MIKEFIEKIYWHTKKTTLSIDDAVRDFDLVHMIFNQLIGRLRGFFICFFRYARKFPFVDSGVKINFARKVYLGRNVVLGRGVYIDGFGYDGVYIGDNVSIGSFTRLIVGRNYRKLGQGISISANVGIGEFSYIGGAANVRIGKGCIIGQYFSIHPENHNFKDLELEIRFQGTTRKGVLIGDNCWIGSKVTILDGAKIGSGCVVAAGAVVTGSFGDNEVIGGVPAKRLKYRYD
jgi:acetyltransferase-like isoleucine patch superfamily enzyme